MVEQIYDKKRWGLSEKQNSIRFKTKKYEDSMNGRIGWRQKKWEQNEWQNRIANKRWGLNNQTKKYAYLRKGRFWILTKKKKKKPKNKFLHPQLIADAIHKQEISEDPVEIRRDAKKHIIATAKVYKAKVYKDAWRGANCNNGQDRGHLHSRIIKVDQACHIHVY